ncbi:hypothetical protein LTR17_003473 [Elasticomyces elasticus]|nr:hypothetical protein LTR17_003473 [Elasticomyces elasticus]
MSSPSMTKEAAALIVQGVFDSGALFSRDDNFVLDREVRVKIGPGDFFPAMYKHLTQLKRCLSKVEKEAMTNNLKILLNSVPQNRWQSIKADVQYKIEIYRRISMSTLDYRSVEYREPFAAHGQRENFIVACEFAKAVASKSTLPTEVETAITPASIPQSLTQEEAAVVVQDILESGVLFTGADMRRRDILEREVCDKIRPLMLFSTLRQHLEQLSQINSSVDTKVMLDNLVFLVRRVGNADNVCELPEMFLEIRAIQRLQYDKIARPVEAEIGRLELMERLCKAMENTEGIAVTASMAPEPTCASVTMPVRAAKARESGAKAEHASSESADTDLITPSSVAEGVTSLTASAACLHKKTTQLEHRLAVLKMLSYREA